MLTLVFFPLNMVAHELHNNASKIRRILFFNFEDLHSFKDVNYVKRLRCF
jgi:hypothetical protein